MNTSKSARARPYYFFGVNQSRYSIPEVSKKVIVGAQAFSPYLTYVISGFIMKGLDNCKHAYTAFRNIRYA